MDWGAFNLSLQLGLYTVLLLLPIAVLTARWPSLSTAAGIIIALGILLVAARGLRAAARRLARGPLTRSMSCLSGIRPATR